MFCGQCFVLFWVVVLLSNKVTCKLPQFRVLAPQFVCPKDEDTPVDKPDNTVITLQTAAGANFPVAWTVRWSPLPAPTQRFTIMLWKAARALETRLNKPPKEPYVYIIDNDELLHGVDYVFQVSSIEPDGALSTPKSFHIDNTYGDQKLDMIEGRADLLSIVLIGGLVTFADVEFVLDAQFIWTIRSSDPEEQVDVSSNRGAHLQIPPYSLRAGYSYDVNCEVVKESTGNRITQTGLPFQVLHKGLEVFLNVDHLEVPINKAFAIEAIVFNHEYYQEPISFTWDCKFTEEPCDFETMVRDNGTLSFPSGLLNMGRYEIKVTAITNVMQKTASATATLNTVEKSLPVIQVTPMHRIINEGSKVHLVANASNVASACTLMWYFATEEFLTLDLGNNDTYKDWQHGEPLSEMITIFSLEENFLNELTDFTNETEWRQMTAEMTAASGRARLVAECGCSMTFECETKGMVYADVNFKLNESPKPGEIIISPASGTALESIFRISTLAVVDPDFPLRYAFYCRVGVNETMLLGSFIEHRAVETFLPYVGNFDKTLVKFVLGNPLDRTRDLRLSNLSLFLLGYHRFYIRCTLPFPWEPDYQMGPLSTLLETYDVRNESNKIISCDTGILYRLYDGGTELWTEVCDILGACSSGISYKIMLSPGNGATMEAFLIDVKGHLRRCEMMYFNIDVMSAVITYMNTNQTDILTAFIKSLLETLSVISEDCVNRHDHSSLLSWLAGRGIDTSELIQ